MKSKCINPSSICLLRLSAIGDVCHAVATVRSIRHRYPYASITWIIGKVEYQLVKRMEDIHFVVFDKTSKWRSLYSTWKKLRGKRFDVLLHMQTSLLASLVSLSVSSPRRIGFHKSRAREGQSLFVNDHIELPQGFHVLDNFMQFAKAIGADPEEKNWEIPVSSQDQQFALHHIPSHQQVLIVCPGASKAEKNWQPSKYAKVIAHAYTKGIRAILCGANTQVEQELAREILQSAHVPIQNLIGKTSISQLYALLGRAAIVLAPDTGPLHMASIQGVPVIGLYAHSNPLRTGPYRFPEGVVSIYDEVVARQAVKLEKWGQKAKGKDLMAKIPTDRVLQKFDEIWSQR